jgi:glucose/arabinose dehydrogenase
MGLISETFTLGFLSLSLFLLLIIPYLQYSIDINAKQQQQPALRIVPSKDKLPALRDPSLKVELIFKERMYPTSIALLAPGDILILEKNKGTVNRILNGTMSEKPLLDVNVANKKYERGMLGIAIAQNRYVYLYFTQSEGNDGTDDCPTNDYCKPLGNRVYRYELVNEKLINPKLLLDLPSTPGPGHNGGAILLGPDNNSLYVPIGDVDGSFNPAGQFIRTQTQNYINSSVVDGRSGILAIDIDGNPMVGQGLLGNDYPLVLYYAYGIRNSFGIDFDPVTGNLWDTENGPDFGDEINLVEPGFNSGWAKVQGIWKLTQLEDAGEVLPDLALQQQNNSILVHFGGKGKYSSPEFIWYKSIAPTAIKFLDSNKYGRQYENDMFVGDKNNGNLYHFDLNINRTQLALEGPLVDKIADSSRELGDVIFGEGFGGITDIEVGPDGYLYVVSSEGMIFRIVPRGHTNDT